MMASFSDIMAALTRHTDAWQFNEPVNEDYAPYYYTLIEVSVEWGATPCPCIPKFLVKWALMGIGIKTVKT